MCVAVTSSILLVLNSLEAGKWFSLLFPSPSPGLHLPILLTCRWTQGADAGDESLSHSPSGERLLRHPLFLQGLAPPGLSLF